MSSHDLLLNTLANGIIENEAAFMRQVRIVPESLDGRVLGIRLFGVTPQSVFGALGIENGDRIEAINGYDMSSPENAMSAYDSFRRSKDLVVQLNRRGETMRLHYVVH